MAEVETRRMILRHFEAGDAPAFYRLGSIPEIIQYVGNVPFKSVLEAEAALVAAPLRDYQVHGYGRFACIWKETGEIIGFSGLKFIEELSETELGYRFLPEFWGLGLATEAGEASIRYARISLGLKKLIGLAHPDNAASARVLGKLGFSANGTAKLHALGDLEFVLYETEI